MIRPRVFLPFFLGMSPTSPLKYHIPPPDAIAPHRDIRRICMFFSTFSILQDH